MSTYKMVIDGYIQLLTNIRFQIVMGLRYPCFFFDKSLNNDVDRPRIMKRISFDILGNEGLSVMNR